MLWCMMQFKSFPYPACFGRLKSLIQRRYVMCVQVVADKDDSFSIRIVDIDKFLYLLRPVLLAPLCLDGYATPSAKRLGEHKAAACPFADIFVINLLRVVHLGKMDGFPRVSMKFDRLLVHAYDRISGIVWSGVHFKNILHRSNERGILLRWNAPHLPQVRLIFVFFRMRPTWVCEIVSMISISTALSDIKRRVQRLYPSGGVLHAMAMILASISPVHLAGTGGVSRFLRLMPFPGSAVSASDRSRKFSFIPCTA